jgi:hypothetical protein
MKEMISLYLEQTPPLILAMKKSLQDKDWHTLHASVHKMIPSFAIVGIDKDFEKMAKKIQEYAITQELNDEIHVMVEKIEEVCYRACLELKDEYNKLKES